MASFRKKPNTGSLIIGSKVFDVNTVYSNFEQRYAAAQAALRSTQFGRGELITLVRDGDNVKFQIAATRAVVNTIEEAVNEVDSLHLQEMTTFSLKRGAGGKVQKVRNFFDKFGAPQANFKDMIEQLQSLSETDPMYKALKKAGIDIDSIADLEVDLLTMSTDKSGAGEVARRVSELVSDGRLNGITVMNDDGARVMQFRTNGKILSSYQANLLLSATGHDLLDKDKILAAYEAKDAAKVASVLEKTGKRQRAFLSARDISLSDNQLSEVIQRFSKGKKSLHEIMLVTDPQYEMLMKFAFGADFKDKIGNLDIAEYYQKEDANQYIKNVLNDFDTKFKTKTKDLEEFKASIRRFHETGVGKQNNGWMSDQLLKHLDDDFIKGDKTRGTIVHGLYKNIEQAWDGSDALNKKFLDTHLKVLRGKKKELMNLLNSSSASAIEKNDAKRAILELDSLIRLVKDGELGQITGRGSMMVEQVGKNLNIKNAWDASQNFVGELQKYAGVISKFSFKGDTGIAGNIQSFIISGISANAKEQVYFDPALAAFNTDYIADPETLKAMENHGETLLREFKGAIESNTIPPKLLKVLERQAGQDIGLMPGHMQASAMRNREFAQQILEMHRSGVSPKDSPMMMSMLHNALATEAYRDKKGFYQPVLPEVKRFQLDTERIRNGTGKSSRLGTGYEKLTGGIMIDGTTFAEDMDVLKFRVEGHKVLLPNHAVGRFHHSLGGFDLDDKGLPKLVTYQTKEGKNRLGFYLFRQPSGLEERIFMRAQLDDATTLTDTVRSLFDNEYFNKYLNEMYEQSRSTYRGITDATKAGKYIEDVHQPLMYLRQILTGSEKEQQKAAEALASRSGDLEQAIFSVYERMQQRGVTNVVSLSKKGAQKLAQSGSSVLGLGDIVEGTYDRSGKLKFTGVTPGFNKSEIYKVLLDDGAIDLQEDFLGIIDKSEINNKLKAKLKTSKNFESMMKTLSDYAGTSPTRQAEIMALTAEAYQHAAMKGAATSGGFLGTYVNRSMVVSATAEQYSDLLGTLDDSVKKYMVDNFRIGMLAQETAIDLSVNFTNAKNLHQTTRMLIEQQAGLVNAENLSASLAKMFEIAKEGGSVTIDDIGELMIENMSRAIGFTRGLQLQDESLRLGIDKYLLQSRLDKGDSKKILENIIYGMEQFKESGFATDVPDGFEDQLKLFKDTLTSALSEDDQANIRKVLMDNIALDEHHEYGRITRAYRLGESMHLSWEEARKAGITQITHDPVLNMAVVSDIDKGLGNYILKTHQGDLESIFGDIKKLMKDATNLEVYDYSARANEIGQRILADITAASQYKGATMQGILTQIEREGRPLGVDIGQLKYIVDSSGEAMIPEAKEAFDNVFLARKVRNIEFYKNFDQSLADSLITGFRQQGKTMRDSIENISDIAQELLETNSNMEQTMRDTILSIAGRESEIVASPAASEAENKLARQRARMEAQILRNKMEEEALIGEGKLGQMTRLAAEGALEQADETIGLTDDIISAGVRAEEGNLDNAAGLARAKFTKISDAIKSGELQKVISEPFIKKASLGIGALILASFAYSAFRDRQHERTQGPPMLPGGAAYEDVPVRVPEIGTISGQGYNPGMTYNVSVNGNQDQVARFNQAASGLVNGNINTTMYNRIPQVGKDPYSSIASSY